MPIILVRHGEADNQIRDITGGWTDTDLTPLGIKQAMKAGERISQLINGAPCRVVSSDLKRAYKTAEIIGQNLNVKPEAYFDLREFNNGEATWKTKKEAEQIFEAPTYPTLDWCPYPGAETWRRFHKRISDVMDKIFRSFDETLIIVGHSGSLVNVTHWWLKLPLNMIDDISYKFDNGSITILSVTDLHERLIEVLNDTRHLNPLS